MIKFLAASFTLALALSSCEKETVSDFCKQIETIGEDRLLRRYDDSEFRALKLDRKRALLALRKAYDTHCGGVR